MPRIAIIGLGYVGLPVALACAKRFGDVIGFDIDPDRVSELRAGRDRTREADCGTLRRASIHFTTKAQALAAADTFIVCAPTPIDQDRRPDLAPLRRASEIIGGALRPGALVIYESTVYPGVTEEFCGPILAERSGLVQGRDFSLGYSPERINPGDRTHTIEKIIKVVAGDSPEATARLVELYGAIVPAGIHVAPSIKVAEAAKALENTQRDLNIALMNELALICDLVGIRTKDVIDAASTKWNFLPFTPGLVGGHCVGVDPYYLTAKAESLGYHPDVILAGRRINDSMGAHIAQRVIRFLGRTPRPLGESRVAVMGMTFKEDVPDIRNSRVPDIIRELARFGVSAMTTDPFASPKEVHREYGLRLCELSTIRDMDALVLAVPHASYRADAADLLARLRPGGLIVDVKSVLSPDQIPSDLCYCSL
jgi:UDP-N-acetyl-D-galactosamine dehydrogenase